MSAPSEGGRKSTSSTPLLSIITVVLNHSASLERTIESVACQDDTKIEYIVIDGGSHDGCLDILKRREADISCWRSEKDQGIYDAMNKGIAVAQGEWLLFINADDWLEPEVCARLRASVSQEDNFLATAVRFFDRNNNRLGITRPRYVSPADLGKIQEMPFPHPGLFVRRSVFNRLGPFDTTLRIAADLDFVLRMVNNGIRGSVDASLVNANFTTHGASGGIDALKETMEVAIRYGRPRILARLTFCFSLAKKTAIDILPRCLVKLLFRMRKSRHFQKE